MKLHYERILLRLGLCKYLLLKCDAAADITAEMCLN